MSSSGIIKSFDRTHSSGFIEPADGSTDVFFYMGALDRAGWTQIGQVVSYETQYDRLRGRSIAARLKPVEDSTAESDQLIASNGAVRALMPQK